MDYRLNQQLCKVAWRKGIPWLRVGTVTKVTKTTYYIDHGKKRGIDWTVDWEEAIATEYKILLTMWGTYSEKLMARHDWTYDRSMYTLCRLRRLERKIRSHRKREPQ